MGRVPAGITEKRELLHVLARELRLPDYFGVNWDALHDCVRDFAWIEARTIVLIHADVPLAGDRRNAGIYLSILTDAVRQWTASTEHDLIVVFPPEFRAAVAALIAEREPE